MLCVTLGPNINEKYPASKNMDTIWDFPAGERTDCLLSRTDIKIRNEMKPILLFVSALFLANVAFSQDVFHKMAAGTCECLKKKDIRSKPADALQVELGLCLIEQMGQNEKELKKAGYNPQSLDIYEKVGEKVGLQLAVSCPEFMAVVSDMMNDENSDLKERVEKRLEERSDAPVGVKVYEAFSGEVKGVEYGDFAKISVKGADGKRKDFYWITSFDGDDDLIALESLDKLTGKKVTVIYYEEEVYFHKMKTYLGINHITGFTIE